MNRIPHLLALSSMAVLLFTAGPAMSQTAAPAPAKSASKGKTGGKTAPANPVDLNTASESDLVAVPGIGASTAKKIIAGRPYSSVSDLSKAGISAQSIKAISPMVKASGGTPMSATTTAKSAPVPMASKPAPPAAPATLPAKPAKTASSAPSATPVAGGGPGVVWVNLETKVYHVQGDKFYGTTKKGKYMKESDALAAGYHKSKEK